MHSFKTLRFQGMFTGFGPEVSWKQFSGCIGREQASSEVIRSSSRLQNNAPIDGPILHGPHPKTVEAAWCR